MFGDKINRGYLFYNWRHMGDGKVTGNLFSSANSANNNSHDNYPQVDNRGLPKPQFVASNKAGNGYITYSADAKPEHLLTRKESLSFLDRVFASCPKPSLFQNWRESLGMLSDWALGRGEPNRVFTQCAPQVQDLAHAEGVNRARNLMYEKNSGLPFEEWDPVTNYRSSFGLPGLFSAGLDATEQFVGSYRVEIFPSENRMLQFEVSNKTSMESFLYGLGYDYERSELSYGGNMRQVYTWEEPLKEGY
jgi:hypothetical protein